MKGKFGTAALMFVGGIALASPVSTPNQISDTPIISGGGSVGNLNMNNCRAYQTDGAAINLSGGETLVFYGGGNKAGGYLSTKPTYSGTAYVRLSRMCSNWWGCWNDGSAIGLFARNTNAQQDFIAGAGGSFAGSYSSYGYWWWGWWRSWSSQSTVTRCNPASGGGWQGEPAYCTETQDQSSYSYYYYPSSSRVRDTSSYTGRGGSVYDGGYWLNGYYNYYYYYWGYYYYYSYSYPSAGFYGSSTGGGASSISAWYDYYTKNYTLPTTSVTITGGGTTGQGRLYVCQ